MVDPGVGFGPLSLDPVITGGEPIRGDLRHGDEAYPWYSWDSILITGIQRIRRELGLPVLVGVSRKCLPWRLKTLRGEVIIKLQQGRYDLYDAY